MKVARIIKPAKAGRVQVIKCSAGLPFRDAGVRLCGFCTAPVEKGGVEQGSLIFCNELHREIGVRYRMLWDQAREAARRYDTEEAKGQIDYALAHEYLVAELNGIHKPVPEPVVQQEQLTSA